MSNGVASVLAERENELHGRPATPAEIAELRAALGDALVPVFLSDWMLSYPLAETQFCLSEDGDESGLGADMQWLTPRQMIGEATDAYPGRLAAPLGYLPVGSCLVGSGDYYYLKTGAGDDPPLVRIPHEAADVDDGLDLDRIEQVAARLSDFLRKAEIG
jgi:hypothetical protein